MKCGVCGRENAGGLDYCSYCGSPLSRPRPIIRRPDRRTACIIAAVSVVAIVLIVAAAVQLQDSGQGDREQLPEVWLSDTVLLRGSLADGTFTATLDGDTLDVVYNGPEQGYGSYIWSLRGGSGTFETWFEPVPSVSIRIGDLSPGEYELTMSTRGLLVSGDIVVYEEPQPGAQWD